MRQLIIEYRKTSPTHFTVASNFASVHIYNIRVTQCTTLSRLFILASRKHYRLLHDERLSDYLITWFVFITVYADHILICLYMLLVSGYHWSTCRLMIDTVQSENSQNLRCTIQSYQLCVALWCFLYSLFAPASRSYQPLLLSSSICTIPHWCILLNTSS